jgi:RNA polymerase sigma factor (sigma-70 family)
VTRNRAWAEDAVQDGFTRIWQGRERYLRGAPERVAALIVVAVKCSALNILRREKRFAHEPLDGHTFELADASAAPADIAESKDTLGRLRVMVSQMDEVNRAVFEMKCLLGMSDRQISLTLGITPNAVATRCHRMRKVLRDKLTEEGYIDG